MEVETAEIQCIEHYLERIQHSWIESGCGDAPLDIVEETLSEVPEGSALEFLLRGEQAFHRGNFQEALQGYVKAREAPLQRFFCHRALAFVLAEQQRHHEALDRIQKALAMRENDYASLQLLHRLLAEEDRAGEAEKVEAHLAALKSESPEESSAVACDEELDPMSHSLLEEEQPVDSSIEWEYPSEREADSFELESWSPYAEVERPALGDNALLTRIAAWRSAREEALLHYVEQSRSRSDLGESFLTIMDGWERRPDSDEDSDLLMPDLFNRSSHGIYFRWCGRGIAINPGPYFLQRLHRQGHSVRSIDAVVVTRPEELFCGDVEAIHTLNYRYNEASGERHVIHYYLEESVHRQLSHRLKPHFKQERDAVHVLGRYVDSPEIERVALFDGVLLSYLYGASGSSAREGVLIRLDLEWRDEESLFPEKNPSRSLAYLSGSSWSQEMGRLCEGCDLLFAGVGRTDEEDCERLRYTEGCLGFFGAATLAQESQPAVMVLGEFDGAEGDLRVELTEQLRREMDDWSLPTVVLLGEIGLYIDLVRLQVRCARSEEMVSAREIRLLRPQRTYGTIRYLSPRCLL